ncbi:restriction endonuclease subunit S [uncultured Thiohalocapsa sp.]|uniref:restriction endonuclease subunit S n=1 Tax=uncultured Thiohalocapsa sp. TaxID=768990 RepID=UPI0025EE3F44|nr:restriction endonuclease subunit S [uncultured Thiohalocapsa sp.]
MSYFAHSDELPEWAAHVPEGWGSNWLKWSVDLSTKRPTEEEQEALPFISNEDIAPWTGKLLVEEPKPAEADSRRFHKDDVLFNKLRPYLAKVLHATFDGVSSGELLCLRPSQTVEPRFLFYVLVSKGFIDTINAETFGAKMPRADWEIVGHQPLPLPAPDTQRRIVQFLDEKTARIDGLIEKKRALLDRLAEKRQALITRAVTKGLNPDAPLKPSGIDWLGDIPAHWEKGNIRRFAQMKTGHTPSRSNPEYWDECTIPWFTLADVWQLRDGTRWYLEETAEKISEIGLANSAAELLPAGTVVFSRTASVGFSGIMPQPMATTQDFWNWICGPKLTSEYLLLLFRSMRQKFEESTSGSTHKTIYQGIAAGLEICVAPIEEQREIACLVFEWAAAIDAAARQVRSSIDLLSEYRAALITAAVTGKIESLE